jgi:hypothetical protein
MLLLAILPNIVPALTLDLATQITIALPTTPCSLSPCISPTQTLSTTQTVVEDFDPRQENTLLEIGLSNTISIH